MNSVSTVLVVDDNPVMRAFAADTFRDLGAKVYDAYNGQRALEILDEHPDIGLLFADIRMPGLDGHGLAEAALLRHPDLRVVLTSGYVGESGRAGTSFVPKPWHPDRLRALIEDAANKVDED
jgi:CheY-like chemotaxis protein